MLIGLLFLAAMHTDSLGPEVRKYVRVGTPRVILEHVEIIDGTGMPQVADRNITIEAGRITAITPGADQATSDGTTVLDLRGYTVFPGIVGMHDHLWYYDRSRPQGDGTVGRPNVDLTMTYSAPRLYLANGVTTARTIGSVNPYAELTVKQQIETGVAPGPHLEVTSPFLNQGASTATGLPGITNAEEARATVAFWADRGVTFFKAYTNITRDELRSVVQEVHKRGLKVTGHLCSVTYDEAVALGIDNLEHGFGANTALDPDKKPDTCSASRGDSTLAHMQPGGADANRLIALLIQHHVAITSTLVGLDRSAHPEIPLRPAVFQAMSPKARLEYAYWRNEVGTGRPQAAVLLRRDMDLQRQFVAAGGLLITGPDPVGIGGNLPGFGDHRQIELLVEAGFSPVEAIRIATLNGAVFLGRQDRIGSVAVGKNADLVVVKGDPAARIADIEDVEIVFKDGVGYDTNKLLASVNACYGDY